MKDITPQTLVYDLLNDYPQLEETLIQTAPIFIKLKNPVLRKTIARVTTLKQASVVGNVSLSILINTLRKAAGLEEIFTIQNTTTTLSSGFPEWIANSEISVVYNACEDIERGEHPLAKIMHDIRELNPGQVYKLVTPFLPAPLIDKVKNKGFRTWVSEKNSLFETFIAPGE